MSEFVVVSAAANNQNIIMIRFDSKEFRNCSENDWLNKMEGRKTKQNAVAFAFFLGISSTKVDRNYMKDCQKSGVSS